MRVVVVDDSAFMRKAISAMLAGDPAIAVIGTARNGAEAVEMVQRLRPDLVTMDIEMPEMDGLTALQRIMHDCPTRVLMLSSLTTQGSRAALRALSLGAVDVLAKDTSQISLSIGNIKDDLLARVKTLGASRHWQFAGGPSVAAQHGANAATFHCDQFDVVCIGSSTGGPPVLETILTRLPASLGVPVVVAQHMPGIFTASMAERLNQMCNLPVVHVEQSMPLERGKVYIAPGGRQLHLTRTGTLTRQLLVNDLPADALYKPSVDILFASAAEAIGRRVLAIVLTGMGVDGLEGARALHQREAVILAQNEPTCVVYGMPKAVTENALVAASLDPQQIAAALTALARECPHIVRQDGTVAGSV